MHEPKARCSIRAPQHIKSAELKCLRWSIPLFVTGAQLRKWMMLRKRWRCHVLFNPLLPLSRRCAARSPRRSVVARLSTAPSLADIKRSLLFRFNGPLARRWVSVKSLATLLVAPFSPTCFRGGKIKRERMKGADKRWEGEGRIQWFLPSVWILVWWKWFGALSLAAYC